MGEKRRGRGKGGGKKRKNGKREKNDKVKGDAGGLYGTWEGIGMKKLRIRRGSR